MDLVANAPFNLGNLLAAVAAQNADRIAVATMEDSVTYAQLRGIVVNFAAHMRQRGIGRSSCVALNIAHPVVAVGLTLACTLVGAAWVPATRDAGENKDLRITHVLAEAGGNLPTLKGGIVIDPSWTEPPKGAPVNLAFRGYAAPDDTWMITQSSGTTGTPKFMAVTERIGWMRATRTRAAGFPPHPVFATLSPPLSTLGISDALRILAAGGTVIFADVLEFIGSLRVDGVGGSPGHFMKLLDAAPPVAARIPVAIISGGMARRPFFARMLRYFAAVSYTYASAEVSHVTIAMITEMAGADEAGGEGVVGAGRVLPDAALQIVDEDDIALPPMQEGIIRMRTPWQVNAYIGAPELSARIFRDGWVYPGDTGYLTEDGELFVTGRVNEQFNIGGEKLNPDIIDNVIHATPGIKDGACFALPNANGIDRLVAAIVPADGAQLPAILQELSKRFRARFETPHIPRQVFVVAALPRNPNGKVMRRHLPQSVHAVVPMGLPGVPRG